MAVLKLGTVDMGKMPADKGEFLQPYHRWMATHLRDREQFRDEANNAWNDFVEMQGKEVLRIQTFLKNKGFFPNCQFSGIYGYGTQAAVRLFQEYVHNIEGDKSIGAPDGIVGDNTWKHMMRWEAGDIKNTWAQFGIDNPSQEYKDWMAILNAAKKHYMTAKNVILDQIRNAPSTGDTLPPEEWSFNPHETHLIGIRRHQEVARQDRENDDLFILLIKGLAFTFWGSTDPSSKMADRTDEAFLVEGQHKYRLSWHKISNATKIYKALRPYSKGVLVYRDVINDNALTDADIKKGLDVPNMTINIHWSGDGGLNFSAGCQVIAGRSYISPEGRIIDCSEYSSPSYAGLAQGRTRGAYNVLSDLVVCYNQLGNNRVWYMLGRESNLSEIDDRFPQDFTKDTVQKLKSI